MGLSLGCPAWILVLSYMPLLSIQPNLFCQPHPESAFVLTCNKLDPAPFALHLPVPLCCPCLDKSVYNFSTREYIHEILRPGPHKCVFFFMRRAVLDHNASRPNPDNITSDNIFLCRNHSRPGLYQAISKPFKKVPRKYIIYRDVSSQNATQRRRNALLCGRHKRCPYDENHFGNESADS